MRIKFKGFELSINERKGDLVQIFHVIKKISLTCKKCEDVIEIAYVVTMVIYQLQDGGVGITNLGGFLLL